MTRTKAALDTNILVYAYGLDGAEKRAVARELIAGHGSGDLLLPVQVLGELFAVLTRKGGLLPAAAAISVTKWQAAYAVIPTTPAVFEDAMLLAGRHGLKIWDSIVFAAAASAKCRTLFSEDMQNGFVWNGVKIVNPFAAT